MISTTDDEPLHVLDLPQIHEKPSGTDLLKVLALLTLQPRAFGTSAKLPKGPAVQPAGELREAVWDNASARLSERSGRAAMPAMSRIFEIPGSSGESHTLTLHEPSLTADNLGMKTWVSSYLLARRLHSIFESPPELVETGTTPNVVSSKNESPLRALELGAGTGLVGLAFAAVAGKSATVHLTDLPEIVPNLAHNAALNVELLRGVGSTATTGILDWSVAPTLTPTAEDQFDVVLAADPLYSPSHPAWLVQTIGFWLRRKKHARVVVEMPLRGPYLPQVREFRERMTELGLSIVDEGEEVGYDDWEGADGDVLEVKCWWSIWGWSNTA
ncbi:hypothetical protein N7470_007142 [Penicillium chermesinum]|nr:hypothetical protein N7470_007142 [Penicillium chermesinum]